MLIPNCKHDISHFFLEVRMKRAESIQERQASVEGILIAKIYFFFKINHYYISFESIPVKIAFDSEKRMNTKFELPTFIFMQI